MLFTQFSSHLSRDYILVSPRNLLVHLPSPFHPQLSRKVTHFTKVYDSLSLAHFLLPLDDGGCGGRGRISPRQKMTFLLNSIHFLSLTEKCF
jgi:hypothetical protein